MKLAKADLRVHPSLLPVLGALLLAACGGGTGAPETDGNATDAKVVSEALAPAPAVNASTTDAASTDANSDADTLPPSDAESTASRLALAPVVTPDTPTSSAPAPTGSTDSGASSTTGTGDSQVSAPDVSSGTTSPSPSPATDTLPESTSVAVDTLDATPVVGKLTGSGASSLLSKGCTPRVSSDFIDNPTWNNRRLLPRDCALSLVNAPLFSWRQPIDRDLTKPWSFKLRRSTGEPILATTTGSPRLQLGQRLPAGDYEWEVAYTTKFGDRGVRKSDPRRFTVAADASDFLAPNGTTVAAAVARKARPRIVPAGSSYAAMVAKARGGEYAEEYSALLREVDDILKRPLPPAPVEPLSTLTPKQLDNWKRDTLTLLRKESKNIEYLGFAWRFTGNGRYKDAAVARVMNLAAWSPAGATSDESLDTGNVTIFVSLSRALDQFSGALTSTQEARIVASIKSRIGQTIASFGHFDEFPYDSHGVSAVRDVVDALLYSAGSPGFAESEGWLAKYWDLMLATLTTWGADDGSWGNGVTYGWQMMDGFADNLVGVRAITGVDLTQSPWVRGVGDFFIANTAPAGSHMSAFGDGTEKSDMYKMYARDQYRLYAALTRQPHHDWYWRVGAPTTSKFITLSPFHFVALGLNQAPVVPAAPARSSFVFEDAGVVALHDDAKATNRSSVFFRSSRFGSANHSFADQNSFTLVSKGRDLLVSGGYYPWYLSPHHATVTRATRYKNALTFDGGIGQAEPVPNPSAPGQPEQTMDARGQIINFLDRGGWAVTTGDATRAYAGWKEADRTWTPFLSNAVRTVAYNRTERVLVIYDWATSATARRWELNFNGLEAFTASGTGARITNTTASACIDVHATPGSFSTTQGFAVKPEKVRPTQYQARFQAATASQALVAVTVIREDCRTVPVAVNASATSASVSINGAAPITFDRRTVVVP